MDLFNNNPTMERIKQGMSQEMLDNYKSMGERMYASLPNDDENKSVSLEYEDKEDMTEATAYILEGVKSGLHPSFLTDNEKRVLETNLGAEWYVPLGYSKEDLETLEYKQKLGRNDKCRCRSGKKYKYCCLTRG
jgi:preprotein translocase subunit SecA